MNDPSSDLLEEVRAIGELGFDYVDFTVEGPRAMVMVENLNGGKIWSLEDYKHIAEEGGICFNLDVGHANLDSEKLRVEGFLKNFPPGSKPMHAYIR